MNTSNELHEEMTTESERDKALERIRKEFGGDPQVEDAVKELKAQAEGSSDEIVIRYDTRIKDNDIPFKVLKSLERAGYEIVRRECSAGSPIFKAYVRRRRDRIHVQTEWGGTGLWSAKYVL